MKTLEYVKEHIDEIEKDKFIDGRFTKRLMDFIPVSEWEKYGFKFTGKKPPTVKKWTEENILSQLKKDVEFGIEKAEDHRGISSSLMYEVCQSWCIILENGLEDIDYGWYGDKLFKEIDKKYNWGLTDGHFDNNFYEDW